MKIEVFDPCGLAEITVPFASRVESLDNKTIGLLSNGHWQAGRTFPLLKELLAERYPTAKIVTLDAGYGFDKDPVIEQLIAAGCDAAIVGHAA